MKKKPKSQNKRLITYIYGKQVFQHPEPTEAETVSFFTCRYWRCAGECVDNLVQISSFCRQSHAPSQRGTFLWRCSHTVGSLMVFGVSVCSLQEAGQNAGNYSCVFFATCWVKQMLCWLDSVHKTFHWNAVSACICTAPSSTCLKPDFKVFI